MLGLFGPWFAALAACGSSAPSLQAAAGAGDGTSGSTSDPSGGSSSVAGSDSGSNSVAGSVSDGGAAGSTAAGGGVGGAGGAMAACLPPAPDASAGALTLHIAGDSTAAIFPATDPRVGWGAVLQPFFMDAVKVHDAAQSGRSSKSFIDEGLWTTLKTQIHPGDYVFIEFGHNDEKNADSLRYTNPATTYRDYLKTYVCETRSLGAIPILLTSISRRSFAGALITATHGAYPAAVIAVGAETSTPVIDMTERTRVWLEALGPDASLPFFAPGDNTHLSASGAPEVAKLVVAGIVDANLPLASELLP